MFSSIFIHTPETKIILLALIELHHSNVILGKDYFKFYFCQLHSGSTL